jgi:hypothetical protein
VPGALGYERRQAALKALVGHLGWGIMAQCYFLGTALGSSNARAAGASVALVLMVHTTSVAFLVYLALTTLSK